MAPSTRAIERPSTPKRSERVCEYDTIAKARFFDAWDTRDGSKTQGALAREAGTSAPTASRWLKERAQIGSPARRHTRRRSAILGRKSRISKETCEMLELYKAQIEYHHLPLKRRQLRRKLFQHTKNAKRFHQAYIKKRMSKKNKEKRVEYGLEHQGKSVEDFWQFIFFTDEAHIDPSSNSVGYILREEGTRYDSVNIQERGEKTGYIEKPKRPRKPQKRKKETPEQFSHRLLEWDALIGHDKDVKPQGNAMTQKYYTERLLPIYIEAVSQARLNQRYPESWWLMEDGDPSHGMPCWNILKQRVRRSLWDNLEQLKGIIQDEWSKITMEEVRRRISDMPRRCKLVVETGGKAIKTAQW
ncbi:hypothetical protein V2W45_1519188 [Cenococcum geophilum]